MIRAQMQSLGGAREVQIKTGYEASTAFLIMRGDPISFFEAMRGDPIAFFPKFALAFASAAFAPVAAWFSWPSFPLRPD